MGEKIEITVAVPDDAEGITAVYYKTWLDTYPNKELGITVEDIEDSYKDAFTPAEIQKLKERIAAPDKNIKRLVAKDGNLLVGVITLVRKESHNFLQTIYVLPEYQGKGIGKRLWSEAKKFCDPAKDVVVHLAPYSKKTIEFYKKLGFADTGKRWEDERFRMKSGSVIPDMEMVLKAN